MVHNFIDQKVISSNILVKIDTDCKVDNLRAAQTNLMLIPEITNSNQQSCLKLFEHKFIPIKLQSFMSKISILLANFGA